MAVGAMREFTYEPPSFVDLYARAPRGNLTTQRLRHIGLQSMESRYLPPMVTDGGPTEEGERGRGRPRRRG
eukprot:7669367-Pyramimonas_sp.AAC.1